MYLRQHGKGWLVVKNRIEKSIWLALAGLVLFPIMALSAMYWSLNYSVSDEDEVYAAGCHTNVTSYGSVVYCDETSEGSCEFTTFPAWEDNCSVKCPETSGPTIIGSLNHQVRESEENCALGVDYDCVGNLTLSCQEDATDIFCGSYCRPRNGCV